MLSNHLSYVPKVHNGVIGFNNPIIPAMIWISFILTAGTSENEENILNERGHDMEVDLIYHKLAIYSILRYLVAI